MMIVEIGKEYKVSNRWKKTFEEIESFTNPEKEGKIFVTICWRFGEYVVTPQNEEEVNELQAHMNDSECEDTVCITDFEEIEMISTWDGCSEDVDFSDHFTEEEKETIMEGYYEDGWSYLDESGWFSDDLEVYVYNGVTVESFKGYGNDDE